MKNFLNNKYLKLQIQTTKNRLKHINQRWRSITKTQDLQIVELSIDKEIIISYRQWKDIETLVLWTIEVMYHKACYQGIKQLIKRLDQIQSRHPWWTVKVSKLCTPQRYKLNLLPSYKASHRIQQMMVKVSLSNQY